MNSWHVDDEMIHRYIAGQLPDATAWSLESHVPGCATCRERVAVTSSVRGRLDDIWRSVDVNIRSRQQPMIVRLLFAAGMPDHLAVVLGATPALTLSWLVGVTATLGVAVMTSWSGDGSARSALPFLVVAPLLPLAGVAAAFGPRVDPTYEIGLAAPMRSGQLLLLRALAVFATTLPIALVAGLLLPGLDWTLAAWIIPAFALTGVALALSSRFSPLLSCIGVALVWLCAVAVGESGQLAAMTLFGSGAQLAFLALFVGAAATTAMRWERYDMGVKR